MNDMTNWYQELIKPWWAPPTKAFGIAWGIIYPIIFVTFGNVFWLYFQNKISAWVALPFLLNLAFNFAFTYLQFTLRNQTLAFIDILLVVLTLMWAIVAIYPHKSWIAWAQVPYLLWGMYATSLQAYIWWYN